jgi:hypothetical protein
LNDSLKSASENKYIGVKTHLETAITLFSNRNSPDYRNCIKESISAVESICQIISGDNKAELGKALKIISNKINIHQALQQGFIKIYGYTSDSSGIRHSLLDESTVSFEDAKYMLIACSAFINYLIEKYRKII